MIDPSLIVARRTINNTFSLIREFYSRGRELRFYFPKSFQNVLYGSETYEENPVFNFFLQKAYPSDLRELRTLTEEHSNIIIGFEVSQEHKEKYRWFYESLSEQPRFWGEYFDEAVLSVLFEEWIFLHEYSWVVSRVKKPFNKFIDAGTVCLQFGKKTVETLTRKTLNKNDNDLINKIDMLKAFGKWIAVGWLSASLNLNPVISTFGNAVAGYFLLFDPEETTFFPATQPALL